MLPGTDLHRDNMTRAANAGFSAATELAAYLVGRGIPFRDANEIVGKTVRYCIDNDKGLSELSLDELQALNWQIETDVFEVLTLEGSVASRNHLGGTAPTQVKLAALRARKALGSEG